MFDALWLMSEGTYVYWAEGKPWQMGQCASGAVYRAKVERVSPALGGAFVSLGDAKALLKSAASYQVGDVVVVRIVEPPKGEKLAVVSDRVGKDGRYLVYLPNEQKVRFSSRIAQEDRVALKARLSLPQGGFVVRSAALAAPSCTIEKEAETLLAFWRDLSKDVGYLYEPKPDYAALIAQAKEVWSDDEVLAQQVGAQYVPNLGERVRAIEPNSRVVKTAEGVTLVFDRTEAAMVVDVNSGTYMPALDPVSAADATNRLAAKELVRQLSLRDLTGMILVDFVSTPQEKGKALLAYLTTLTKQFDPRLHVVDYTKLGIVEMTRAAR